DFSRYKIFPARNSGQRYHQQAGTGCYLYVLNSVRKDLTDTSVPLHFTEGEKKAAAGVQLGLAMIGLGGLWNFRDTETGELITELTNGIAWADRKAYLYPDSDVWSRPDLLRAVYWLGMELDGMGADVRVVQLPQSGTKKVGLDDYLLGDGNEQSTDAKSRLIRRQEKALDLKHHALSQFKDWYVAKKKERQQKKDAHKNGPALQGRAITFVPTEPWPQPADGAQLVKDIIAAIGRFAVMQDHERIAIAFWILHSHAHSAADCSPILTHLSPTPGCGKTQALGVEKRLVPKPLASSNCSASAIFRCVEAHRPTLLIDEGDSFFSLDEALRGILNSGHTRTTAYVLRSEGKDNEPRQFATWSPKILAAIGKLPLTIMQRSIIIHMRKRKKSEPVERFLDRREYPEL